MRHRASWCALRLVAGASALAVMITCARAPEERVRTAAGVLLDPTDPGGDVEAMSRAQFVDWAEDFSYQAPDSSLGYAFGFADSVRVEVLSRLPDSGHFRGHLVGRLITQRAYRSLGMGVGRNYVWVDSGAAGYETTIYAEDPAVSSVTHSTVVHSQPPSVQVDTIIRGQCLRCGDVKRPLWCETVYAAALR